MANQAPRLRTVNKSVAPFPLNSFPKELPMILGREIVYLLTTKGIPVLEGPEWERIFALCIFADWKPSNVGLDDVVLGNTAWGAKTVKAASPATVKKIRLISGRNAPSFSYGNDVSIKHDPELIGEQILDIWNARVTGVREKYQNVRTIVLIKSNDLSEVALYEQDTIRYDPELFTWKWISNTRGSTNLMGYSKRDMSKKFTWQPSGGQFTIHEEIRTPRLVINIRKPPVLDKELVLSGIGFTDDWISYRLVQQS